MIRIVILGYNYFFLPIFIGVIYILSLFNDKVKKGIKDRAVEKRTLPKKIASLQPGKNNIWFHSSSMGEFEQAKPIIEKLITEENVNIIVSFFSPSGYENSLKYSHADVVTYIPIDTEKRCRDFIQTIKPEAAVFMRYDIWPNMIMELSKTDIPILLVDATMKEGSPRRIGFSEKFHSYLYNKIDRILTVSEGDKKNFLEFNILEEKIQIVGDTRFDRVYQKSLAAKSKNLFKENFFEGKKVFVMGSSWGNDEEVMLPAVKKLMSKIDDIILIIAPHEPTIKTLQQLEDQFDSSLPVIRFSSLNNYTDERVILIDSIGILLSLYYYADAAFVGGGFKQHVHNVLEPAVYGIPVLFGPKFSKSQEAFSLIEEGSARVIHDKKEAYKILLKLFTDDEHRKELGRISGEYVKRNIGATEKIVSEIKYYLSSS